MKQRILLGLALATSLAHAALGDAPGAPDAPPPSAQSPQSLQSSQAPQVAPAAAQPVQKTTSAGVAYTDVRRTLRGQVEVHELVDAQGIVFAVTWSGPFKPDLKELLGRHFDSFRDKGAQHRGGNRSQLAVDTGEAVVVSSGHMRAFEGRAWLPSRLPAGFDPQEMK